MTYKALIEAISRLIIKRQENALNAEMVAEINAKLEKLYAIKYTMQEQRGGIKI